MRRRAFEDQGSAVLEFLIIGLLVLVPLLYAGGRSAGDG